MPVTNAPVPNEIRQALENGLSDFLETGRGFGLQLRVAPKGFPIATTSLNEIVNGSALLNSHPAGWSFLEGQPGRSSIVVHVNKLGSAPPSVMSVSQGRNLGVLAEVLEDAERLEAQGEQTYEPWILKLPSVLIEAVWLKSKSAGPESDVVIPFHTQSEELELKRRYTVQEFEEIVRNIGQGFLPFNDVSKKDRA